MLFYQFNIAEPEDDINWLVQFKAIMSMGLISLIP